MDIVKNVFLSIGCVAFALLLALCILMCVPTTRTGIYRMLNVSPTKEKTQMADEKTELYIETVNYRAQLQSLSNEKTRIETQLQNLQESYDKGVSMLADYQETITRLNQDLANANNTNNNLQYQIQGLNINIQNLNSQIDNYNIQIQNLNNDLMNLNNQYSNLSFQIDLVTAQRDELSNQNSILSNEITNLTIERTNLNYEITLLQDKTQWQNDQIQNLENTIVSLNNQIIELSNQIANLQNNNNDFQIGIDNIGCYKSIYFGAYDENNNLLYGTGEQETFDRSYFAGSTLINEVEDYKEVVTNLQKSVQFGFNPTMSFGEYIRITAGTHQTHYQLNQTNYSFTENTDIQLRVFYNDSMIDYNQIESYLEERNYEYEIHFENGNDAEHNLTNFYINISIWDYSIV